MSPLPGMPGSQVSNDGDIMRMIADLQRQIKELAAQDLLTPVGITAQPNGITVTGTETVNGSLNVNGPMNVAGAMAVTGTLSLPAGIIGNDALQNPLSTGSAGLSTYNMAFNATAADYGSSTITVPAGFTKALVTNGVSAGAMNSGASDYIYVASGIYSTVGGSRTGGETPTYALNGTYGSASAFGITNIVGLSGGQTITVSARVRTGTGTWAAAGGNVVNVNAIAIFYR